jgi:predicted Zn finger-like uncharacterized protein
VGRKRPQRTARRAGERDARRLVRDREKLAALVPGGSEAHPIEVGSAAVVEVRVGALACPQCAGSYRLVEHRAPHSGIRAVDVRCTQCGVARTLWFRLVSDEPN